MVNQRLLNNWLWCIKIVYSRDNIGLKTVELAINNHRHLVEFLRLFRHVIDQCLFWLTDWCRWRESHSCGQVESGWFSWQRTTKQNSGWSMYHQLYVLISDIIVGGVVLLWLITVIEMYTFCALCGPQEVWNRLEPLPGRMTWKARFCFIMFSFAWISS